MTATADALKAWKVEEARQAQILATAIDAAIQEAAKQFDAPIMNALCGALVRCRRQYFLPYQTRTTVKSCARQWKAPSRVRWRRQSPTVTVTVRQS